MPLQDEDDDEEDELDEEALTEDDDDNEEVSAPACMRLGIGMQLRGTEKLQVWQQHLFPTGCNPTLS